VTSLVVFIFEASDTATFGAANALATIVAVIVGFAAGGFFTGFLARRAPILHGLGLGVTSIVAWVAVNAVASLAGRGFDSGGLTATGAVGIVLAQMIAAVIGALVGYNVALRGKPGLSEDIGAG
jgi:hypothetical protein